jgi:ankyrin repeat protein
MSGDDYASEAEELFRGLQSGSDGAAWCFKWDHPRFKGKDVAEVRAATLDLDDARLVIARRYSFDTWADLQAHVDEVSRDGDVARFEAAVDAVVSGDADTLRSMLAADPGLVRARSSRNHHATLLHYVAANGVEGSRQKTPANAVEIAAILLDAGAEPDALADMYDAKCTTMSMLVSSAHPAQAGVQAQLAELLLDRGAAFEGPGTNWQSAVLTALAFGYRETAEALAKRGAPIATLGAAAGLGRLDDVKRLLPEADAREQHAATALAAQHGQADVLRLLLDAGEDPNRYNPEGYHGHSTPLHQAVWAEHMDVVRLLVERGARLDLEDRIYHGTPLRWAIFGEKNRAAEYLRAQGAK